jgi:hypothetical protein
MSLRLKAGEHTCLGQFDSAPAEGDSDAMIERDALLVYTGTFDSMDGAVAINDDHIERLVSNHNSRLSRLKRMVSGETAVLKGCPPIQLDHSVSARETVGRLVGDVRKGVYRDEETGTEHMGIYGKVRVLGRENVEKVKDGRWIHLSIGADLDDPKLNEVSITPFPAAANASLLASRKAKMAESKQRIDVSYGYEIWEVIPSGGGRKVYRVVKRGKTIGEAPSEGAAREIIESHDDPGYDAPRFSQGENMTGWQKFTASVKKLFKLSEDKEASDKAEKMKKHLMDEAKCSDDDAVKKLAEMDDEGKKKLSDEIDEKEKKLAADKEAEDKLAAEKCPKCDKAPCACADMAATPPAGKDLDTQEKNEPEHKFTKEQKASFITLAKGIKSTGSSVRMEARKAKINARLASLRASAKITPAEVKKIDIAKLALDNDATVNAVLKSYEDREPVIIPGIFGTVKAESAAAISEAYRLGTLEAETRANMPMLNHARLAAEKEGVAADPKAPAAPTGGMRRLSSEPAPGAAPGAPAQMSSEDCELAYGAMCKMMDEGRIQEAKDAMRSLLDQMSKGKMSDAGPEGQPTETSMSALATSVESLQTQFSDLVKLVGPSLGVEAAELGEGA